MTPADLPPLPLEGIGVVGIVILIGWLIASGRLVTRREADKIEHDRDEWRAESRLKDAQIAEKDRQLEHMGEVGRLVQDIMRALQRSSREVER